MQDARGLAALPPIQIQGAFEGPAVEHLEELLLFLCAP